jgi:hypothetical protein
MLQVTHPTPEGVRSMDENTESSLKLTGTYAVPSWSADGWNSIWCRSEWDMSQLFWLMTQRNILAARMRLSSRYPKEYEAWMKLRK